MTQIHFVSRGTDRLRVVVGSVNARAVKPVVEIGNVELHSPGAGSYL